MRVTEKDPRMPFVIGPERAETIRRQVDEVVHAAILSGRMVGGEQVAEWERDRLEKAAVAILEKIHGKRMDGRLRHWQTLCRFNGCEKQTRTSNQPITGRKVRRRNFMFCPDHAGVRNLISKRDHQRLKNYSNLRVVAEE